MKYNKKGDKFIFRAGNGYFSGILALFIIGLLLFSMTIGCRNPLDRTTTSTITGKVTDKEGKPIGDVFVTVIPMIIVNGKPIEDTSVTRDIMITNSNGMYTTITGVSAGTYILRASKPGYITSKSIITVKDEFYSCENGVITKDMVLEKLEEYILVTKWGTYGTGDGQFYIPEGIAVDGFGNVFVVDNDNHRVQKFSSDGTFITKWGSYGDGDEQLYEPYGIAVDRSGYVYVTDLVICRVQKFSSDGTFITKWGSYGDGDGDFQFPKGIAVDDYGNVYVTDKYHIIQKFTSNGTFITKIGSAGNSEGQFSFPEGIAVDDSGNVYVGDVDQHYIQKFTSEGTLLAKWGISDGKFPSFSGLAVDNSGNVYAVDGSNCRILKFRKK